MSCFRWLDLAGRISSVFLLAATLPAQDPIFHVPVRLIIAPTSVTDAHGKFINGLRAADFALYDNEVRQQIHEDADFLPISMVAAIQTNLEVAAIRPKIRDLGPLLGTLVVGAGGEAAILTFNKKVRMLQDFTSDLGLITHSLRQIEFTQDNSHLIDATLHAIRLLEKRPPERRRIILLISETRDQGSDSQLRDAVAEAELHNILIYSLNVSRLHAMKQVFLPAYDGPKGTALSIDLMLLIKEIYGGVKTVAAENPLSVLTRYTGGKQYSFLKRRSLEDAITKIGEEIHGQYLLSYRPSNTPGSGYHKIRVEMNRSQFAVRSRPGYWWMAQDFLTVPEER